MRFVGYAVVALYLVLGLGGVSYTEAADPAHEAGQCSEASAPRGRQLSAEQLAKAQGGQRAIVLNTRGYNYRRAGESAPTPIVPVEKSADAEPPAEK